MRLFLECLFIISIYRQVENEINVITYVNDVAHLISCTVSC